MPSLIVTRPTDSERSSRDPGTLDRPPAQPAMKRAETDDETDDEAEDRSEALLGHDETEGGSGKGGLGSGLSYATALEGVANLATGAPQLQSIRPGSIPPAMQQFIEGLKLAVPQTIQDLAITSRGGMTASQLPGTTSGERVAMMAMAQAVPSVNQGGVVGAQPGMMGGPMPNSPMPGSPAGAAPAGPPSTLPPGAPPSGGTPGATPQIPPEALMSLLSALGGAGAA